MLAVCLVLLPLVAFTACGGGTRGMAEGKMEAERAPEPAAAPTGPPRVFFVAPEDGAVLSIDHDVEIEFGIENFAISARPDRKTDTSRDRVGHYHLGYNTACLDAGVIIPRGQGWQHFGDGSNATTLENAPAGTYELTVQIGDDEHRAQEGLCSTISIEVAYGE